MPTLDHIHRGYLRKKGRKSLIWKQRLVVLHPDRFSYFQPDTTAPKGTVACSTIIAVHGSPDGAGAKDSTGGASNDFARHCFTVVTQSKAFLFRARTPGDKQVWMRAFRAVLDTHVGRRSIAMSSLGALVPHSPQSPRAASNGASTPTSDGPEHKAPLQSQESFADRRGFLHSQLFMQLSTKPSKLRRYYYVLERTRLVAFAKVADANAAVMDSAGHGVSSKHSNAGGVGRRARKPEAIHPLRGATVALERHTGQGGDMVEGSDGDHHQCGLIVRIAAEHVQYDGPAAARSTSVSSGSGTVSSEAVPVEQAYQYSIRLLCDSIEEAQQWVSALVFNINAVDGALRGASALMDRFQNDDGQTGGMISQQEGAEGRLRESHPASRMASEAPKTSTSDGARAVARAHGGSGNGAGDVSGSPIPAAGSGNARVASAAAPYWGAKANIHASRASDAEMTEVQRVAASKFERGIISEQEYSELVRTDALFERVGRAQTIAVNVFTATWNMNEEAPPQSLRPWIPAGYDIYAIGVQECMHMDLLMEGIRDAVQQPVGSAASASSALASSRASSRRGPPACLDSVSLEYVEFQHHIGSRAKALGYHGYIGLVVLVRAHLVKAGAVDVGGVKAGVRSVMRGQDLVLTKAGNKGAVAVTVPLSLGSVGAIPEADTQITFITCHLAADKHGKVNVSKRHRDALEILRELGLHGHSGDKATQHHGSERGIDEDQDTSALQTDATTDITAVAAAESAEAKLRAGIITEDEYLQILAATGRATAAHTAAALAQNSSASERPNQSGTNSRGNSVETTKSVGRDNVEVEGKATAGAQRESEGSANALLASAAGADGGMGRITGLPTDDHPGTQLNDIERAFAGVSRTTMPKARGKSGNSSRMTSTSVVARDGAAGMPSQVDAGSKTVHRVPEPVAVMLPNASAGVNSGDAGDTGHTSNASSSDGAAGSNDRLRSASAAERFFGALDQPVAERSAAQERGHVIFFGDLNYRLAMDPEAALAGIATAARESAHATSNGASNIGPAPQAVTQYAGGGEGEANNGRGHAWMMLQQHDQLANAMETGAAAAFAGFSEAPLCFAPTFRRVVGADPGDFTDLERLRASYTLGVTEKDGSTSERTPSYTDRILWRSPDNLVGDLVCDEYGSIESPTFRMSDHVPVYAKLRLQAPSRHKVSTWQRISGNVPLSSVSYFSLHSLLQIPFFVSLLHVVDDSGARLANVDHHSLMQLGAHFQIEQIPQGVTLYVEGEQCDSDHHKFYVVVAGNVELRVRRSLAGEAKVHGWFGETALLQTNSATVSPDYSSAGASFRRLHTATASSSCTLLSITRASFRQLAAKMPAVASQLQELLCARSAAALAAIPLFSDLSTASLREAATSFSPKYYAEGERICAQGAQEDDLCVLALGRARAVDESQGQDASKAQGEDRRSDGVVSGVLSELAPGDFFGEFAMLQAWSRAQASQRQPAGDGGTAVAGDGLRPAVASQGATDQVGPASVSGMRTASVYATSFCVVLTLPVAAFTKLCELQPQLLQAVRDLVRMRTAQDLARGFPNTRQHAIDHAVTAAFQ